MIFRKKKLKWEDIELIIARLLSQSKTILTFGTIGSKNLNHDIDVIITKRKEAKSNDFYFEIHTLFDDLDKKLKKRYGVHAIRFTKSYEQEVIEFFNKREKGNVYLHTNIYCSYNQIKLDWSCVLSPDDRVKSLLINNCKYISGKVDDLFSNNFNKKSYYDYLFNFISYYDKIQARYPNDLLIKSMQKSLSYLFRKRLNLVTPQVKNINDCKQAIYLLCSIIDKLNEQKDLIHL